MTLIEFLLFVAACFCAYRVGKLPIHNFISWFKKEFLDEGK